MAARKNKPSYVTRGNVIDDLGFSSGQAAVVKLKAQLHNEILKVVARRKLTPRRLEKILDVPQPRVSELLGGKISKVSSDRLAQYLYRLGRNVEVRTKARRWKTTEAV